MATLGGWSSVIEDIRLRFRGVKLRVARVEVGFVDREVEVERVLGDSPFIGYNMVTVLYGPKGCGKTTFFRVLARSIDPGRHGVIVAIANRVLKRREREVVELARLYAPLSVLERLGESARRVLEKIQVQTPLTPISISMRGVDVGYAALKLARAALMSGANTRRVVVVADEVDARNPYVFKGWLEGLADTVSEYVEQYASRDVELSVVILTSDATAARAMEVVGDKVWWALMWNLHREAAREYIQQLGLEEAASRELGVPMGDVEELLWRLAGGNPRALESIMRKGVVSWLNDNLLKVVNVLRELRGRIGDQKLWKDLDRISESIDNIVEAPYLKRRLLAANIAIQIWGTQPVSELPREAWVGRWYAYQLPIYHYAIKAIHRRRSLDVDHRETLEEAMRG